MGRPPRGSRARSQGSRGPTQPGIRRLGAPPPSRRASSGATPRSLGPLPAGNSTGQGRQPCPPGLSGSHPSGDLRGGAKVPKGGEPRNRAPGVNFRGFSRDEIKVGKSAQVDGSIQKKAPTGQIIAHPQPHTDPSRTADGSNTLIRQRQPHTDPSRAADARRECVSRLSSIVCSGACGALSVLLRRAESESPASAASVGSVQMKREDRLGEVLWLHRSVSPSEHWDPFSCPMFAD